MTAKEYLMQVSILNHRIEIKNRQLEDARERLLSSGGMKYTDGRVVSSPHQDPIGDRVVKSRELETRINAMIDRYIDLRDRITDQINGMEDDRYIQILTQRYIDGMKIRDISKKMHYTEQYIIILHGKALQAFARKYPDILNSQ